MNTRQSSTKRTGPDVTCLPRAEIVHCAFCQWRAIHTYTDNVAEARAFLAERLGEHFTERHLDQMAQFPTERAS